MTSSQHIIDVFLYFFELSIHSLLHGRGVYPASFFEPRGAYAGLSAPMLRHPELCDGICALLASMRPMLLGNAVECALLVLLDPAGRAVERYTFAVDVGAAAAGGATQAHAEAQLGTALHLLQRDARRRATLPPDCTFTVQLRTHGPLGEQAGLPLWAHVDPADAAGGGDGGGSGDGGGGGEVGALPLRARAPIKAIRLGPLTVDVFVESAVY